VKNLISKLLCVLDSFNKARRATAFTRMGRNDLAKDVMTAKDEEMLNWVPMTNDDWDWVNGKQPQPAKS